MPLIGASSISQQIFMKPLTVFPGIGSFKGPCRDGPSVGETKQTELRENWLVLPVCCFWGNPDLRAGTFSLSIDSLSITGDSFPSWPLSM